MSVYDLTAVDLVIENVFVQKVVIGSIPISILLMSVYKFPFSIDRYVSMRQVSKRIDARLVGTYTKVYIPA